MHITKHQRKHKQLFEALQELVEDFLLQHPEKDMSTTNIFELKEWAVRQMKEPDHDG